MRILLVEDNPDDAFLFQTLLTETAGSEFSWECHERISTAVHALKTRTPDLVLMDLGLSDSYGLEAIGQIRSMGDFPVVVLTALNDKRIAQRVLEQGAQDYLIKDRIDGDILAHSLRKALEDHRRNGGAV